jgi:hypothetical protein
MVSQSFTFFFTSDLHLATDRSQQVSWSAPKSSSTASQPLTWVAPGHKR